ncbi:MAG: YggS family pyridoxal phosphate enzyme [Bacteroidales bacterium]|nr:YggS family pyridoxal phosphate enzyme [Bacteroidales bacterium]
MTTKDILNELKMELPATVKLVAVSKFHPFESIAEAYEAGQRVFAESRPQEFLAKIKTLEALREDMVFRVEAGGGDAEADRGYMSDVEWHFIGHLQTNKLKMVLPFVSLVQSVDSVRLLDAIDAWGRANGKVIDVLLECHVSAEDSKQGFSGVELAELLEGWHGRDFVRVRGVMGMATFTDDESVVRSDFARLVAMSDMVRAAFPGHDSNEISMGMSGDYRIAVEMGSTMVRIGSMIFGGRG